MGSSSIASYPYDALVHRAEALDGYRPEKDPTGSWPQRDGTNPVERMAAYRMVRDVAAMPASLVVQILFWPNKLAYFADEIGRSASMIYNTLNRSTGRPYNPVRRALAHRLGVDKQILDHLIDARCPPPRMLLPERAPGLRGSPIAAPPEGDFDPNRPPAERDGTNPLERQAIIHLLANLGAMDASMVVQIALWPANLNRFAEAIGRDATHLYHMLHFRNGHAYMPVRRAVARALGVRVSALAQLVEAPLKGAALSVEPSDSSIEAVRTAQETIQRDIGPVASPATRKRPTPAYQMSLGLST